MAQPRADDLVRASSPDPRTEQAPERQESGSQSVSPFARANTVPRSNRELEADTPGILTRCVKVTAGIKKAVAEMRMEAEAAKCYREKCSVILATAIGASVALDQALYSGNLGEENERELRMLCSEVSSALALGSARIKVYGTQPRWKKYAKRMLHRSPKSRFDEIVEKLTELTQQAWSLQTNTNAVSRFHLARIKPSSRRTSNFSTNPSSQPEEAPPPVAEASAPSSLPQVLLYRTHLRRGAQRFCVKSLLYIPPERSSGPKKPLGQVWWYYSGLCVGRLAVHNVATSETKPIPISQQMPAVMVMAQDIHGNVWTGHKDGYVRIWSESSHNPVCPPFKAMHSDIRCITLDDDGSAWVGSEAGNVKKIELVNLKQPTGGLSKWLEVRVVLKWSRDAALNSTPAQSSTATSTDSRSSRAQSFAAARLSRSSDSAESRRAHGGPIAAISAQGQRVWTSGGLQKQTALRQWSHKGDPRCSVPLDSMGAASAIRVMPQFINVSHRLRIEAAPPANSTASSRSDSPTGRDLLNMGKGMESGLWQLLTAHENGQCMLWDISDPMSLQPIARLSVPGHPAKTIILCEEIGLWGTAHSDGTVELRLLPTGAPDERYTLELEPNQPVPSLNIPQFRAPFCAHRGGLAQAAGSGATMVTASKYGAVTLWPEAELRSIAEGAGFVLPSRAPPGISSGGAVTRQATISQVLQRYFTPHSAAMAEYALANAVINRVKGQAKHSDEAHLSPIASLSSKEGEEAQLIIEEVANLLRNSASSASAAIGAEPLRRMSSRHSSLMSDPERAASAEPLPSAGSAERPLLWGRLTQSPSAPMPLRGGQRDEAEEAMPLAPLAGYSPHPSAPSLAELGDAQGLMSDSQSSSVERQFRSTSLQALAGTWTIPFSELVLKKQIGEGSIGKVHLGKWRETDVAVKILNSLSSIGVAEAEESEFSMDPAKESIGSGSHESREAERGGPLATLEREVNIMAALRHPNIVLFMGVCLDPPCVVSEWCARGSLFDVLSKARKNPALAPQLDWTRRLNMALDAAKGMLQLHSKHIVHRDLKSPNLLVDKHWRVKICDFNLSRVEDMQEKTTSITANNPRWLAPEVISKQAYSKAADVFSFAVILWELITWQMPWEELGVFQIMVSVAEKNQRPDIPAEPENLPGGTFGGWSSYVALIQSCWGNEPAERPSFEAIINVLRELLTASASQTRQRRMTDPISPGAAGGAGSPGGFRTKLAEDSTSPGTLGASDDLPVQPAAPPNPTIDLKDVARLSQHTGAHGRQSDNESNESRSGFTIPIPRSEDSQGTNRSSMDFRHDRRRLSSSSVRRSVSLDTQHRSIDRGKRIQREAALGANTANERALLLLSGYAGNPEHRERNLNRGPGGDVAERPASAGLERGPAESRDEGSAAPDAQGRQVLQSAFASNSAVRFSEDQGRPPLSGRRSNDSETARSSIDSRAGEPPMRTSLEQLNRSVLSDSEAVRPEERLRGLNPPPQVNPMKMRALSKVSEEASSLERESSGRADSSTTGRSGKAIVVDSHGREATSKVLGGIHEQEQEDRRRSSESSEIDPAEAQRWRGHGIPETVKSGETGINPHFLQPVEAVRIHSSSQGSSARHSTLSESRLSQASETSSSPSYRQRAALQELVKEQGRRSLNASGTRPAAVQPEQQKQTSQPEPGTSGDCGGANKPQEGSLRGEQQEGWIPAPQPVEQPSVVQQGPMEGRRRQEGTGESQPEQACPQPSAFSTAGKRGAGAGALGPVRQGAGRDSARSLAPAANPEAAGSSRQGSDPSLPQSSAGSAPSSEQGKVTGGPLEPADSAWPGKGSMAATFSRLFDTGKKVLGLESSSGKLSSATSSIQEGTEGEPDQAAEGRQEGKPSGAKSKTRLARRRSVFGSRASSRA